MMNMLEHYHDSQTLLLFIRECYGKLEPKKVMGLLCPDGIYPRYSTSIELGGNTKKKGTKR